jgi:hypothetical protein
MPRVTLKLVAEVVVFPASVRLIGPVVAQGGTVVLMVVALVTVHLVAETPLNSALHGEVNPVPVMATVVPTGPELGWNELWVEASGLAVLASAVAGAPRASTEMMANAATAHRRGRRTAPLTQPAPANVPLMIDLRRIKGQP